MTIYTDGSCHTQLLVGAWVALVYHKDSKIILQGIATETTHHRMELTAVIAALNYIKANNSAEEIATIVTDSQYVVGLKARKEKFAAQNYKTNKGNEIANADLVKEYLALEATMVVRLVKIKAHQQAGPDTDPNIEADALCRNLVRKIVAGKEAILPGAD